MSEMRLHKGSEMAASQPVNWLLTPGYLAKGKPNLLVGAEGIGKSLWTIRAMASVTTGEAWGPFTITEKPEDVVLIATEDGWSDTIRPRLEVAGADLSKLHILSEELDGTGPATSKDLAVLENSGIQPALVVLDAFQCAAFSYGGRDWHQAAPSQQRDSAHPTGSRACSGSSCRMRRPQPCR